MATWNRLVSGSTAGNISMNIDYAVSSVTRTSNTNVRVVYGIRFSQASSTYTYNNIAAFCPKGGTRYYAFGGNGSSHTSSGTYYYANKTSVSTTTTETIPFTIDIPVTITQTSASFEVGFGWNAYTPAQKGTASITVTFPTGATAPTGLSCAVTESTKTETSVSITGGYSSNGGATVTSSGYQYKKSGGSWANCSSSLTGLEAGATYYFRYYATNSQGTSYSSETSTTMYKYPYIESIGSADLKIGSKQTLKVYNPLKRSCTAYCKQGSTSGTTLGSISGFTAGSGNYELTPVASTMYASIPNSKSGSCVYYLVCSSPSNTSGTVSGTYSINGNENPTFPSTSVTNIIDTLNVGITGDSSKFIQNHNKLKLTIKPMTSNYSAGLDYYTISSNGVTPVTKNYSTSDITFEFGNLSNNSFTVIAVDKRTLSTSVTKNLDSSKWIPYSNPSLTDSNVVRQDGTGDHIIMSLKGNYTNWNGLTKSNSVTSVKYRYKKEKTTTWSSWITIDGVTNSNGTWSISNQILDTVFSNTSRYDIELQVTDLLESVTFSGLIVSTANALVWKDLENKKIGINKKPEFTFDVNGDGNFTALYINGTKMIWYE